MKYAPDILFLAGTICLGVGTVLNLLLKIRAG